MTDPVSRQIGTISRLRNRSTTSPFVALHDQSALQQQRLGEALLQQPRLQAVARHAARNPSPSCSIVSARDAAFGELLRAPARRPAPPAARGSTPRRPRAPSAAPRAAPRRAARRRRRPRRLGQRDAELLRQHAHRVREADLLVQLEELEHVAADAAAEAVEEPLVAD